MRRALLISLLLVLALVSWSAVGAEDDFYVISGVKRNYAPVPKTGQTDSYGTRDDGASQKGVTAPSPRFTDNGNGTVTDRLTGLIWMKNADAFELQNWDDALSTANNLQAGYGGLTDGSEPGDWRLPNLRELQSLIDYGRYIPAFPAVNPFTNLRSSSYWSSTSVADSPTEAWFVYFAYGGVSGSNKSNQYYHVWCVRGGP